MNGLDKITEINLEILADFLEKDVPEEKFDMCTYREKIESGTREGYNVHIEDYLRGDTCGTSGCAMGWAPFAKGLELKESEWDYGDSEILWGSYSDRLFPGLYDAVKFYDAWDWCFSSMWNGADNTPKGAALRIRYLLKNELPEGFENMRLDDGKALHATDFVHLYNQKEASNGKG